MNATNASGSPSEKRTVLPGNIRPIFNQVRLFWVSALVLLALIILGLWMGWSTPRQWSDGLFYAGAAQIIISSVWLYNSSGDIDAAAELRYISGGDVGKSIQQAAAEINHRQPLGVRVFAAGLLTLLLAWVIAQVKIG